MFAAGTLSPQDYRAGQLAPQPVPPGFTAKAAAHLPLFGVCVAACLFSALVTIGVETGRHVLSSAAGERVAYPALSRPVVVVSIASRAPANGP